MQPKIELSWPTNADPQLCIAIHRVFCDVAGLGGAIGFLSPPTRAETDGWLEDTLTAVRSGSAALVVALIDGTVQANGLWRRERDPVFAHSAEIEKVMAHPSSRGLGLGHIITRALIGSARNAGIETLALGVRGNNHGAIELYKRLGLVSARAARRRSSKPLVLAAALPLGFVRCRNPAWCCRGRQ